jgi:hypothetical protein
VLGLLCRFDCRAHTTSLCFFRECLCSLFQCNGNLANGIVLKSFFSFRHWIYKQNRSVSLLCFPVHKVNETFVYSFQFHLYNVLLFGIAISWILFRRWSRQCRWGRLQNSHCTTEHGGDWWSSIYNMSFIQSGSQKVVHVPGLIWWQLLSVIVIWCNLQIIYGARYFWATNRDVLLDLLIVFHYSLVYEIININVGLLTSSLPVYFVNCCFLSISILLQPIE